LRSPQRALPAEKKIESETSQSKSGTSLNLSNSGKFECGDGRETVDEIHDEAEVRGRLKREMQLHDEGVVHDLPGGRSSVFEAHRFLYHST